MEKQRTIERQVSLQGTGLHTAHKVKVTFKPADVNTGITFVRTDLPQRPVIRASVENLLPESGSYRCSAIGMDAIEILTIEHLMAAFVGLGIDNVCIEIDNDEVPGMDGSSDAWVDLIVKAGIKEQDAPDDIVMLREPIYVSEDGATIIAVPSSEYKVSYTMDFNHPYLKTGFLELVINPETFKAELAKARTFCLEEEAGNLQKQGLGKGASYDNTLVVSGKGVINNTLRYPDEFIRHKVLDLVGDLYLLGRPLKAHIIAMKSGHSLNMKLLRKIEQQRLRYASGGIAIQCAKAEELDITDVMNVLPHRYPFLLVDRILSLERGKRVVGIKNVTINDYFFQGHFPGKPVMPGVLIVEAMAQVGGVMMLSVEENRGKIAYFMSIKEAKFRKTVIPGDQLVMEVQAGKMKAKIGQVTGRAFVDGKVVADAELMFALAD